MKLKRYDKILLMSGEYAYIVEILEEDKAYVVDIEKKDGEISTEFIYQKDIRNLVKSTLTRREI